MKRLVFSVLLFTMMAGFVCAQADLQVIANVKIQKTEPITLKQLKTRVEVMQKNLGRILTVDEKKSILDTLINERLVVQAAERDGVRVTDSEANQNFNQMISQQVGRAITEVELAQMIKQQNNMSLDDFMRAQSGMSVAEYKNVLKTQMIGERYAKAKKQADIQNMAGPTDSDIRSYYELNQQNFVQTEMLKLFLIVVPKGETAETAAAASKKLDELHKQLKDKPSSAAELKIRSQAPSSGFQAGEMNITKAATTAQALGITMDALLKIFKMNQNEVSDITETTSDFQCFVIQDKYPAKILTISDVIKPGTTVTVYEYIKNNMMAQAQNNAVNEALIQIINDLRKPENFKIEKSGAELDKVLAW